MKNNKNHKTGTLTGHRFAKIHENMNISLEFNVFFTRFIGPFDLYVLHDCSKCVCVCVYMKHWNLLSFYFYYHNPFPSHWLLLRSMDMLHFLLGVIFRHWKPQNNAIVTFTFIFLNYNKPQDEKKNAHTNDQLRMY